MSKANEAAAGLLAGVKAGHKQARKDKALAADAAHARDVALVPLASITERPGGDTRTPDAEHMEALALSIDALGLLQPLTVDNAGRLLCGGHRLLAVRKLAEKDPDRWKLVPVRRMDFDAEADPNRALAAEVAENEQRRDYTPAEVRALAERLKAAGFKNTAGRPRKGTKALLPALGAVVGKSKRQLIRVLKPEPKMVTHVTFSDAAARLHRALESFTRDAMQSSKGTLSDPQKRAINDAAKLIRRLEKMEGES